MRHIYLLSVALGLFVVATSCLTGAKYKDSCDSDADCFAGYACADEPTLATKICFRACADQTECVGTEICDIPAGEPQGVCRAKP